MSHKGIVCPKCGYRSGEERVSVYGDYVYRSSDFGFTYVTDVVALREIKGINDLGNLVVEGGYSETQDDKNDRLCCHKCGHVFAIPSDVLAGIDWR